MSPRIIAVVGATGNQGGSVASLFASLPDWHVRGLTRDPKKASAQQLTEKGVELVSAELGDVSSLKHAFKDASVVFGTTDFWQHVQDPSAHAEAAARGITVNEIAYEREIQHGHNIVDAAASSPTLTHFVLCTLNKSKELSRGKITFNLHFDSKWATVEYCRNTYPELWDKTRLLQLGVFASNWKSGDAVPKKEGGDGKYILRMPMSGDRKFPMVDPVADTGHFVHGLLSLPPHTNLMGAGSNLSWNDFCAIWGKVNNVNTEFKQIDGAVMEQAMGSVGRELADMFQYMDEFGYDGGDQSVVYPWNVKEKFGVEIKYTTIEEYVKAEDWSSVL